MPSRIETALSKVFDAKHVRAALNHYSELVSAIQKGDWEKGIGRAGKFTEAVVKALYVHVGQTVPPARQFKVGSILTHLKQLPVGSFPDNIRVTIPRACEFIYDVASNRGARHDPDEVDPNELDATAVASTCTWILAELVRFAEKGKFQEAKELVAGLIQRRYPLIEDVDGRTYFHIPGLSGRQIALLTLWHRHPRRLTKAELVESLLRHHITAANANTAVSRVASVVDVDTAGGMRLLQPGIAEAEGLIESSHRTGSNDA
jgi:hypothetical protein